MYALARNNNKKERLHAPFCFILTMLFSIPAMGVGAFMGMYLPFNMEFAYFSMAAANVAVATIILICCRNILEYADYNNK